MINKKNIKNDIANKCVKQYDSSSRRLLSLSNNNYINKRPSFAISDTGRKISVNYIHLSSDNSIKSLKIKNHKINFKKDILEYYIEVDGKTNKLDLSIVLNDKDAFYEVIGNDNFKVGNNKVYIVVTAADGSIKKYIINVKKNNVKKDKVSNSSRNVIILLLVLIIIGLIYVIFKEDEDEES